MKQLTMKKLLALLCGMTFTAGLAFAQATFEELDADDDGMISKEEAAANEELKAAFDSADANKDGKLSQAEFTATILH